MNRDILPDQTLASGQTGSAPRICGAGTAALAALNGSTVPASTLIVHAGDDSLAELVRRGITRGLNPNALREVFTSALGLVEAQLNEKAVITNENIRCSSNDDHACMCDVPDPAHAGL